MKNSILRYIYTILFYAALPFFFLRLLWRSRRSVGYRQRWSERLGFCPHRIERCIWVHTVSVGETIAAIPLIKALQARYPELPLLITNMTITGAARTQAAFGDTVLQAYIPYDVPDAVERFLQRTNPVIALIFETELWPNLFAACQRHAIPILIANARLSPQSALGYQRVSSLTRDMLSAVHTLAVQTQIEADRFVALGLSSKRAIVTGNIKFDLELPQNLSVKSSALRAELGRERLIWIAASTHAGEEEMVLAAHQRILQHIPNALLILVPRHPERFDSVFALAEQQGLQVIRRSQNKPFTSDTNVYLADTMGELLLMYAVCDAAFIGGSFVPVGGHNMLEAAVLEKPVVTGPHLFNFAEISTLLITEKGMITVQDKEALAAEMLRLLQDRDYRTKMGENARRFVDANRGALTKQLEIAASIIDAKISR